VSSYPSFLLKMHTRYLVRFREWAPFVKWEFRRAKVEFSVPLVWCSKLSGESASRAWRKEEENLIAVGVCLADCASYLYSPLHGN
jgi:hypothetical protein